MIDVTFEQNKFKDKLNKDKDKLNKDLVDIVAMIEHAILRIKKIFNKK